MVDIVGVIVGAAYFVAVAMGQLSLDPILFVTSTIQLGAKQLAEPVTGLASLVLYEAECFIECVFAHWALRVGAGKDEFIASSELLEFAEDCNSLAGQGDDMRATGFHAFGWNCPGGVIEIELCPGRLAKFTRSNGCQCQERIACRVIGWILPASLLANGSGSSAKVTCG